MTLIPVNVNNKVRVKLNDLGRKIYDDAYGEIAKRVHGSYDGPKVDAEGWTTFQLWELMELYGPHISLGRLVPFDGNIEVEPNKEIVHAN